MTTIHDDYPHPIPQFANLRWKENWLFVVMAPDQHVYGLVHVNTEPAFDRARFTCNLSVRGRIHKYSNETRFPPDWEGSRRIGDGAVSVRFTKPHKRFEVAVATPELSAQLEFRASHPTFDFAACRSAAPENVSFREVMTLATNLPHDHHQQALTVRGRVSVTDGAADTILQIVGLGYRDHSWCMRADNLIAEHTFSGLLFPKRAIGVKTAAMLLRPGIWAREGYVSDGRGPRALRTADVETHGSGPDGLGEIVRFRLRDVYGEAFTVEASLTERFASLPFVSEKPGDSGSYNLVENLCRVKLVETGETGLGHIELGRNPKLAKETNRGQSG